MNEEELLHLIGKIASSFQTPVEFTDEEIIIVTKCRKEYEFWYKMTSEQKVITYSDNFGNPCGEILLK